MFYKNIILIFFCILLSNCTTTTLDKNKPNKTIVSGYSNKGFALVYSNDLYKQKIIDKKIDERSLIIFQKKLKINTQVKITNIINGKMRIAKELDLDINEPYVEIIEILENSIFVALKAKTYDEEKSVAIKAPVNDISINNLNIIKKDNQGKTNIRFSYVVKIADFYFKDTALMMQNRIKTDSPIKNSKIKKISDKKYRVYLGPFNDINSLQKSYNDISILQFENIEIIKND